MGKTPGKFKRPRFVGAGSGSGLRDGWEGGEAWVMPSSLPAGKFVNLTCIKWQKAAQQPFGFNQTGENPVECDLQKLNDARDRLNVSWRACLSVSSCVLFPGQTLVFGLHSAWHKKLSLHRHVVVGAHRVGLS